jgi:hypothetical protein
MHGNMNVKSDHYIGSNQNIKSILTNPQAFVPLLYFIKSTKQANLVSESISAAVNFRSYEQIKPGREFYFSQKSYRVTQQCSGLRMLENKTYCSC